MGTFRERASQRAVGAEDLFSFLIAEFALGGPVERRVWRVEAQVGRCDDSGPGKGGGRIVGGKGNGGE